MLTQFGGYPAFEVMFDTDGNLVDPNAQAEAMTYFGSGAGKVIDDVIVISHGWNNDIAEARTLYSDFFTALGGVSQKMPQQRTFGVVGLFWPSKKFADPSLIPGGAAGLADPSAVTVSAQLDQFAVLFAADPSTPAKIAHLKALVPVLSVSTSAQDDYVVTLASMIPKPRYEGDEGLDAARFAVDATPGHIVLSMLASPVPTATTPQPGASAIAASPGKPAAGTGGAAGLFGGITSAAARLGDLFTYYTMKDRAGIVGRTGAVALIRALRGARANAPQRVHLAGHSFGGRLVTAAANSLNGGSALETVNSMTLLEAAYSHNGIAKNWDGKGNDGTFRSVITGAKVTGPILITHSSHDLPVGVAYPMASRLANQVAAALGGPNDPYGGMGRNGAQHTPEVLGDFPLAAVMQGGYPPLPAQPALPWIVNIRGDGPAPLPTITSHSDVAKPEIAYVMLNYFDQLY
jgi:hypothetical protein